MEKFSIDIETYYRPDAGQQTNVFNLSAAEKRQRILGERGCHGAGSGCRAGPGACGGSPAVLPGWVCGCAAVPEGLSFSVYATCLALLFALVLAFWGQICGDPGRGRRLNPQLPALSSLGSAAKLESVLKMFWEAVLSFAFFLCLFAALPFLVPACSSTLPCPTQSGVTLPLWVCMGTLTGALRGVSDQMELEKPVPIFPPPVLLLLLPRALLQIALQLWVSLLPTGGTVGQNGEPGVRFLPRRRVRPRPLWPPFPRGVSLVVLGAGVQSVTRSLLKWRPKIGTRRK